MSVEDLKAALSKSAEAPADNEDGINRGVNSVWPVPDDRKPGTIDAKWGDRPPANMVNNGTSVVEAAKDGREDMIERLFDSPKTTAPAEQAAMSALFGGMASAESHSPLLTRGKEKKASDETLTDKVVRIAGRR